MNLAGLVLVVFYVLSCLFNAVYCELGESCKTNEGESGLCKSIENCQQALLDLKRGVSPTICGFIGKQSLVCCGSISSYKIGDIAKTKCDEYSNKKFFVREIVGGVRAASSQFPHMVALGYGQENNIKWNCGGSLISEDFVLTGAHCLSSRDFGEVKYIRAGTITLNPPETTYQDFKVTQTIPYPNYDPSMRYNDIALIKLNRSIEFGISVRPACLETSPNINLIGKLSAIGWGFLSNGGDPSNDLMTVDLVQYSYDKCNLTYSRDLRTLPKGIQEDLMICAGGKENEERDTCNGDSGGPLEISSSNRHIIVGITSFGKICGFQNVPGVYTRVSSYIEWIEKIVWIS